MTAQGISRCTNISSSSFVDKDKMVPTELRPFSIRSLARQHALDNVAVDKEASTVSPRQPERSAEERAEPMASLADSEHVHDGAFVTISDPEVITVAPRPGYRPVLTDQYRLEASAEREPIRVVRYWTVPSTEIAMNSTLSAASCAHSSGAPKEATGFLLQRNPLGKPAPVEMCQSRLGRLFDMYAEALETRPLLFKCVTSAVIGGLGDVCSQGVSWSRGGNVLWHSQKAVRRTLVVAIDGFCFNAPFLHFAYDFLEMWMPTEESMTYAIIQVAVDIFVLDPVYAFIFILTTGLLEGKSVEADIVPVIKTEYLTLVSWLMVIGLLFAPPHIFLFKRFSLKWRVLIADVIDLLWTFFACLIINPE